MNQQEREAQQRKNEQEVLKALERAYKRGYGGPHWGSHLSASTMLVWETGMIGRY